MGGTGSKKDAFQNFGTANDLSNQYSSQALGIEGQLAPQLEAQAANPQGYSPTTMGQMTTAAEETAGGTNAGIAGQAGLRAARTRNVGSGQAATAEGGRAAGQEVSQINAGIQGNNAQLKSRQQAQALSGLGSLYGEDVNAGNNALGLSNQAVQIAGNQKPGFWQQFGQNYANDALTAAMTAATSG
jgi:hypothetical protein